MDRNLYCVIMAGGVGARFWPKSRRSKPKQFLDIFDTGKSFIRLTYERFAGRISPDRFLVATNEAYKHLVNEHLPEVDDRNILCEPVGRNTAPCICYAAYSLFKKDPDAAMIVTPSDHMILDEKSFGEIIDEALDFIDNHNVLMTVGITPSRPETGYGYIQKSDSQVISRVKCFTEKPDLELAEVFVQSGEFFWNSGIFIWKVRDIVAAIERWLPDHHALFSSIIDDLGTPSEQQAVGRVFAQCRAVSIDYGVMEKADNVYVRCGDFGWSDVGTWGSLFQLLPKDENNNAKPESGCFTYDTEDSIISLPRDKVAVINGLHDYIVVDTEDVLMICPRNEEQSIRKYIDEVRYHLGDKHN
ncbi:MAG: mannose-1-phosphate guanylyltransferase [Alistipes sp.]|nr:mannose-1-phosphate guanylyltransferase [Alistipes sp.]